MKSTKSPLSFGQQRIWFVEQMAAGNVAYVNHDVNILRGQLDVVALSGAIQQVVDRHDGLRSRIVPASSGQEPYQWVEAEVEQQLTLVTCPLPADDSAEGLQPIVQEFLRTESARPFDLRAENPIRTFLLRWTPELHALVIIAHHVAVDGWSLMNIVEETSLFYNRSLGATTEEPRQIEVQYPQFAQWQRLMLDDNMIAQEQEFWRTYLQGAPDQCTLPWDGTLGDNAEMSGEMLNLMLPADVNDAIRELAATHRCTLYMVLAAIVSLTLTRYSDQREVVLGSPVAGRLRSEFESTVGLFLNLIAVRVSVDDDATFAQLLKHTRSSSLRAMSHQELPFDEVLRGLSVGRKQGRSPLFQVSLSVNNLPDRPLTLHGLMVEHIQAELRGARYDLTATFVPESEGLRLRLQYDTTRFTEQTMRTFVAHLSQVVRQVSLAPDVPLRTIDLSAEEEKARVRTFSGLESVTAASANCLDFMARLDEVVAQDPDRLAAVCDDDQLTRGELDTEVSCVASSLAALGVGAGDVVAVRMSRGLSFLVVVLAVWRRGATFLPIDPRHPARRVAFMLADAQARLLVTASGIEQLDAPVEVTTVIDVTLRGGCVVASPELAPNSDAIAYIMYTSGSTGQPKGVAVRRSSLSVFCRDAADLVDISTDDVSLSLTTLSFDISLLEYLVPLLAGGSVKFVSQDATDPEAVRRAIDSTPVVSLVGGTPTVWDSLREAGVEIPVGAQVMLGGESLSSTFADYLDGRGLTYWNFYGPTEATVYCLAHRHGGGEAKEVIDVSSCVGAPFGVNRAYVLDAAQQPCPINVPGEVYLSGPQVASGYVGQPELTASRFPLDRIAGDGFRFYRTGDAARWDAQGRLRFLGRMDTQVKIRGYRMELEEIEVRLREHPGVVGAVVGVDEQNPKRLVAGIVPEGAAPKTSELRQHLEKTLPSYMIPSNFLSLKALPMSSAGKLDRRGLAGLTQPSREPADEGGSLHEQAVQSIFRDVLGRDDIGRDTHFFEVGGHSLLAVQVILRLQDIFDRALEAADVFRAPTPRMLAERLGRPAFVDEPAVALRAQGGGTSVVCLPDITGDPWGFLNLLRYIPREYSVHAVRSQLLADQGREADLRKVVDEFLDAIDYLGPPDRVVILGSSVGAALAPFLASELSSAGSEVCGMVMLDPVAISDPQLINSEVELGCDILHIGAATEQGILADRWIPEVTGRMRELIITAAHAAMLETGSMVQYGPELKDTLTGWGQSE